MIQRGRWPIKSNSAARRAACLPGPPMATATILPWDSPSTTGAPADWYFRIFFRPWITSSTSIGRAATMPTSAGTGAGAMPRSSFIVFLESQRAWQVLVHRVRAGSGELPLDHFQGVAQATVDAHRGRHFVADVDHAVLAPGVLAITIILPLGVVQEVGEGLMVPIGDEIARAFPAHQIAGRAGPGCALHLLAFALEELLVDGRRLEAVLAEHGFRG